MGGQAGRQAGGQMGGWEGRWVGAPVSWLSMKVVALEGHQPSRPGGLPSSSFSRQYSVFFTASCGGTR